jgi:two-component system response regulator YesN
MTKLFIVDDEEEIREGLKNKIEWAKYDIEVCGVAENGERALKQITVTLPDVILVDIMMPVMNGLDLVKHLASEWPNIKSIVISGHDDFKYAQAALRLGAVDYLLKPCRPEEIISAIHKAKALSDSQRTQSSERQNDTDVSLQKERFLQKLLDNELYDSDYILQQFSQLGIGMQLSKVIAAIIRIDTIPDSVKQPHEIDDLTLAMIDLISDSLVHNTSVEVLEHRKHIVILISDSGVDQAMLILNKLKAELESRFHVSTTIGLGSLQSQIGKVHLSYLEAQKAINESFIIGSETVISFETIQNAFTRNIAYPYPVEKKILAALKLPEAELSLKELTGEFFAELNAEKVTAEYCIKACLSLLLSSYHFCIESGLDAEEVFGTNFTHMDAINQMSSVFQARQKIEQILISINQLAFEHKRLNHTINLATSYMKQHFTENIRLDTIASQVFVSPQYLSRLFKSVLHVNFLDYLNQLRIDFAIELLSNPALKVYEIASLCGYNNDKYFGIVFKKRTGKTPVQFRAMLR